MSRAKRYQEEVLRIHRVERGVFDRSVSVVAGEDHGVLPAGAGDAAAAAVGGRGGAA